MQPNLKFSRSEYADRLAKTRSAMEAKGVDLLIVSDPSQRGLVTAQRISQLRNDLNIGIDNAYLIVNRAPAASLPEPLQAIVDKMDIPLLGVIPTDASINEYDYSGKPMLEWDDNSSMALAIQAIAKKMLG